MNRILSENCPQAYEDAYWVMKTNGKQGNSRNGPVLKLIGPTVLTILKPLERVLFDRERDCNPFFHVMETIWMLAGDDHVGFPARFNSTYVRYAEADGVVHGAYGKRWRNHFQPKEIGPRYRMDQIQVVIAMLKKNIDDRRAVLSMWDTQEDLGASKNDLPCNTHIYFDASNGRLDMTVCNRSNDLIWGMLGANVVHMTYLQELIAFGVGVPVGEYNVMTNNLHLYTENPKAQIFMQGTVPSDHYRGMLIQPMSLLQEGETVDQFFEDCERFVKSGSGIKNYNTEWMRKVGYWMYAAYIAKGDTRINLINEIKAPDWRLACQQWNERKIQSSVTSMAPSR